MKNRETPLDPLILGRSFFAALVDTEPLAVRADLAGAFLWLKRRGELLRRCLYGGRFANSDAADS